MFFICFVRVFIFKKDHMFVIYTFNVHIFITCKTYTTSKSCLCSQSLAPLQKIYEQIIVYACCLSSLLYSHRSATRPSNSLIILKYFLFLQNLKKLFPTAYEEHEWMTYKAHRRAWSEDGRKVDTQTQTNKCAHTHTHT